MTMVVVMVVAVALAAAGLLRAACSQTCCLCKLVL
jgi:hypothetical protein